MKAILAPPISKEDLGKFAVQAALGNIAVTDSDRVINVDRLTEEAR
jgi:hypothetical protein